MAGNDPEPPATGPAPGADGSDAPGDSLRGFLRRGEAFIEEILRENETLRLRTVQLESKLQEARSPVPEPVAADELRNIFEQLRKEHDELRRRLDEVASETEQYKVRYQAIEEENDRLVNLFVSAYQLHSSLDFREVVQVIVEILLNFVGAGRFAVLLWDASTQRFRPLETYGASLDEVPDYPRDAPPLKSALDTGKPDIADTPVQGWDPDHPRVSIPLKVADEVVGAIVVYSYLEQKEAISPIDQELFGLLGDHGGIVLESARLAASVPNEPNRFDACVRLMNRGEESDA